MRQVNNWIKNIFLGWFIAFFFGGCIGYIEPQYSTKTFENSVSQDQLLNSAKKIFRSNESEDFIIESYRDKIVVIRPNLSFLTIDPIIRNDRFEFMVEQDDTQEGIKASLAIQRLCEEENPHPGYLEASSSAHQYFWEKLEKILETNTSIQTQEKPQDKKNLQVIDLGDVMNKSSQKMINKIETTDRAIPSIKNEKKGTKEMTSSVKSFSLEDISIQERKPSKQTPDIGEEESDVEENE